VPCARGLTRRAAPTRTARGSRYCVLEADCVPLAVPSTSDRLRRATPQGRHAQPSAVYALAMLVSRDDGRSRARSSCLCTRGTIVALLIPLVTFQTVGPNVPFPLDHSNATRKMIVQHSLRCSRHTYRCLPPTTPDEGPDPSASWPLPTPARSRALVTGSWLTRPVLALHLDHCNPLSGTRDAT